MRAKIFMPLLAVFTGLWFTTVVRGQVPPLINYQGHLADANGKPLNGAFTVKFEIFGSSSGGIASWNETQSVTITNGGFSVLLGSSSPIPLNLFDADASTYLQLTVNGTVLSPRRQFGSVPYALTSRATGWTVSGDNIYRSSGKVGIGTSNPRDPLGIRAQGTQQGLISFEDPNGVTKWHLEQNFGGNTPGLNFVETGVADFRLFIKAGGNVGIGTSNPTSRLYVNGTFTATSLKSATVVTESFGQRKLYAVESASVRFMDEGTGKLRGGTASIALDPVFVETIEGELTVHVTPYGPASLFVAERGNGYFVVKSLDGKDVEFAWQVSAFRKGYANVRLEKSE